MPATVSHVVKPCQQDWTRQLEPDAIRGACRDIDYLWRQRLLDPVVTMQLFFVQILHGNTACTHLRHLAKLAVTASAYCQARMKLPLRVLQRCCGGSALAYNTSRWTRAAGGAIAPFGSMARVFRCPIPLHCKSILVNRGGRNPDVAFPLPT